MVHRRTKRRARKFTRPDCDDCTIDDYLSGRMPLPNTRSPSPPDNCAATLNLQVLVRGELSPNDQHQLADDNQDMIIQPEEVAAECDAETDSETVQNAADYAPLNLVLSECTDAHRYKAELEEMQKQLACEKLKVSKLEQHAASLQLQLESQGHTEKELRGQIAKLKSNYQPRSKPALVLPVVATPLSQRDKDGQAMFRSAVAVLNKRICKGEEADVLLCNPKEMTDPATKSLNIKKSILDSCAKKSGRKFSTFVSCVATTVFKKDGAQYFTLDGTNRSSGELRTLAMPSSYVKIFLNTVMFQGFQMKMKLPDYCKKLAQQKDALQQAYHCCAKKTLSRWLTSLRKKYRPSRAGQQTRDSDEMEKDGSSEGEEEESESDS